MYINDLVTVIVPAFNAGKFIDQCMQSLVDQTYQNLEILVLNDGSTDDTLAKLNSWCMRDGRVRVISRQNKGLIATLNELISESNGRYIARMDADDYCDADRIRLQVLALNKGLALVGSNCLVIDEESRIVGFYKFERKHINIQVDGFFRVQFCHPAVMFDLSKIDRRDLCYDSEFRHAEDLELWFRLLRKYRCGNLAADLLYLRRGHATNVSTVHAGEQFENTVTTIERHAGIKISKVDILNLRQRASVGKLLGSGLCVGYALSQTSIWRGFAFFRKLLLIAIVTSVRQLSKNG